MEFFEKGLAHLATLDCPVVVGNIPDAKSSVGRVLSKEQYPGTGLVEKANARLAEWVKNHPNIALMDLHKFHQHASTNQEMEVTGQTIPAGQARKLYLQWDQLHPTPTGAAAIAKVAIETLENHHSE
jgi:lysophospholipase L1-like esterase